jgi:phosphotransferase system  glucose/maltose/N-acetylglucosamine-specific IIC component
MENLLFYVVAGWLLQAVGFALLGEARTCGMAAPFFASLLCGPGVALAVILCAKDKDDLAHKLLDSNSGTAGTQPGSE